MSSRAEMIAGWLEELTVEQEEINDLLKHVIRHRARIREKLELLQQLKELEQDTAAKGRPEVPQPAPEAPRANGRSVSDAILDDSLDGEIEAAARELFGQAS